MFADLHDYAINSAAPEFKPYVEEICERAMRARNHIAEFGVYEAMRVEGDEDSESGTGGFLDYEEVLAAIMLAAWSREAIKARKVILHRLNGSYTAADLADGLEEASRSMSSIVTSDDTLAMRGAHVQLARRGAAVVNALTAFDAIPTNAQIFDGMTRASKYWTNGYFNNHVIPSLQRSVQDFIASNGLTEPSAVYNIIRQQLDDRLLRRVPYWHTVSSSAASRAYHYGIIKGGRRVGYRGYRLVAVRDDRTSGICIALDGKEFWLADAERLYDDIARAESEDIKDVHPWIMGEEMRGLTENEVYERAVYVPPFHGRCRTQMQLLW